MLPDDLKEIILDLGQRNNTEQKANALLRFLNNNYEKCIQDYKNTSTKKRCSTGKLESKIFTKLAFVCQWQNGNGNSKQSSDIMIKLGYLSYHINPDRFRQKIENEKKKRKNNKNNYLSKEVDYDEPDNMYEENELSHVTNLPASHSAIKEKESNINPVPVVTVKQTQYDIKEPSFTTSTTLLPCNSITANYKHFIYTNHSQLDDFSDEDIFGRIDLPNQLNQSDSYNDMMGPSLFGFNNTGSVLPSNDAPICFTSSQAEDTMANKQSGIINYPEDDLYKGYLQDWNNEYLLSDDLNSDNNMYYDF